MSFLGFGVRASAFRGICRLLSIARQGGPSSKAFGFSSLGALGVYLLQGFDGPNLDKCNARNVARVCDR